MKKRGLIAVLLFAILCSACTNVKKSETNKSSMEDFYFRLTWGCYGISSYDSETGKLVKTKDATHLEDYITNYKLTDEELEEIYDLIEELDVETYPDYYNPNEGEMSSPTMTLILVVNTGDGEKMIAAKDIAISYNSKDRKGQKFLDACKTIRDILIETKEWKALPEYEFLYD